MRRWWRGQCLCNLGTDPWLLHICHQLESRARCHCGQSSWQSCPWGCPTRQCLSSSLHTRLRCSCQVGSVAPHPASDKRSHGSALRSRTCDKGTHSWTLSLSRRRLFCRVASSIRVWLHFWHAGGWRDARVSWRAFDSSQACSGPSWFVGRQLDLSSRCGSRNQGFSEWREPRLL